MCFYGWIPDFRNKLSELLNEFNRIIFVILTLKKIEFLLKSKIRCD